jgi:hypothetical protein
MVQVDVGITTRRQLSQETQVAPAVWVSPAKVATSLLQHRDRMAHRVKKAAMEAIGVLLEMRVQEAEHQRVEPPAARSTKDH